MKYPTALAAFVLILGSVTSGFGHPPGDVNAQFDLETYLLTIAVTHEVKDPSKHYVDRIEVELNGKKMIEQNFGSQEDGNIQEVIYRLIGAEVEDEIKVTARCNVSGKKKAVIKVEEKVKAKEEGVEGTRSEE